MGRQPFVPTSGTVRFLDHDLTKAGDSALTEFRRDHVGFVFQFYNLVDHPVSLGDGFRVEIGHRTGASVEITGGLKPGERVVLFPSDKVDDGSRIR